MSGLLMAWPQPCPFLDSCPGPHLQPRTWPNAWAVSPVTPPGPGHPAASLEGVGSRLSREQLQVALTQPRRLHPGAKMPSYAYLPDGERQALLDFLTNLK